MHTSAQSQKNGIGTVVPNSKLEIRGIGTTSVTSSLNVTTSDSTSVFYIRDDKRIGINNASPQYNLDAIGTVRIQATAGGGTNSATGGTITTSGAYTIHTFTTSGTFTPAQDMVVDYLVVGGGGAGGSCTYFTASGGGGGAGGVLIGTNQYLTPQSYSITVGGGGTPGAGNSNVDGGSGGNSLFGSIATATGGGGGCHGGNGGVGVNGGSGGGGYITAGTGVAGQGYAGGINTSTFGNNIYALGGGGGASEVGASSSGTQSGNGGAGVSNSYSGSAVTYGGGGGAGGLNGRTTNGTGGAGGGGNGGLNTNGVAATANTGSGGGGSGNGTSAGQGYAGGAGGSGIVIIRYLTSPSQAITLVGDAAGRVAVSHTSPTAFLHLPSSSGAGNFAPLKFTSGTNLTTAEAGAVEYDGTRLYYTTSTPTRITLLGHNLGLSGGSTLIGGSASGENLTLKSTSHATKGKILFGTSAYDEVNNRLGLGTTTPGYLLTVNGQPAANGYTAFTNYSDSRLKKEIAEVEGGNLEKIMLLHPVKFKYNNDYLQFYNDSAVVDRQQKGFIAQEVREIFPEMVGTVRVNGNEYYDLNLSNLPVYLVKAMQEQQNIIMDLKAQLESYKARLEALENK